MKPAGAGGAHLTYCTNIHRGETWSDTRVALERHLPDVKRAVSPNAAMGVGLRLSAIAAEKLSNPEQFEAFRDFLRRQDLYVFTINGFPYGPFHGARVKEQVYQPDWRFAERLTYTNRLADLLAALLPDDVDLEGSVSTVPATFRPIGRDEGAIDAIVANLTAHVAHLAALRERTGRSIAIALEPEPMCYLETTAEALRFIETRMFARGTLDALAGRLGVARPAAEAALRRHLGLCYDVCHAAVEFEDAVEGFALIAAAGVAVPKIQLSSALRIAKVGRDIAEKLRRFDDGVYLHQVVEKTESGALLRHLDLAPALAQASSAVGREWRVHCHVPVFMADLPGLGTTQDMLRTVLTLHRASPLTRHLEVETYTFDVLPPELREADVATAVARELNWVLGELAR